jgi:hypothetical protein
MLRDQDVDRIILEEQLRWSVRRELEPVPKESEPSFGLWGFLNSALGLLLISSVVVGGLGKLYSDHQKRAQEDIKRQAELVKITSEIDNRVTRIESFLRDISDPVLPPDKRQQDTIYIWRIVVGDRQYLPPLPEFRNTHFNGLLLQLRLNGLKVETKDAGKASIEIEDDARRLRYSFRESDIAKHVAVLAQFNAKLSEAVTVPSSRPSLAEALSFIFPAFILLGAVLRSDRVRPNRITPRINNDERHGRAHLKRRRILP